MRGNSNKYPQPMFLGVLNTVFLTISNYLPHLELRNRSIRIVVIKNFVVISNVGIKSFDFIQCNWHNFKGMDTPVRETTLSEMLLHALSIYSEKKKFAPTERQPVSEEDRFTGKKQTESH